jgi:hypothetical protein
MVVCFVVSPLPKDKNNYHKKKRYKIKDNYCDEKKRENLKKIFLSKFVKIVVYI